MANLSGGPRKGKGEGSGKLLKNLINFGWRDRIKKHMHLGGSGIQVDVRVCRDRSGATREDKGSLKKYGSFSKATLEVAPESRCESS